MWRPSRNGHRNGCRYLLRHTDATPGVSLSLPLSTTDSQLLFNFSPSTSLSRFFYLPPLLLFFFSTFLVFLFMPWEEKSLGRRPFSPETLRLHVRKRVAFQKRRVFFGSIDVTKNILRDNSHKILLEPDNRNTDGSVDRFRRMDRQRSARETRRNTAVTGFHERDGRFSEKRKNNFVESAFR